MDLRQQVKNFEATRAALQGTAAAGGGAQQEQWQQQLLQQPAVKLHQAALQALSNGLQPPYSATLREVKHEGSRAPRSGPVKSMKPPGYCRNAIGGFYTS